MPRYVVFDSSYDVREYIGFIEAPNEWCAKCNLVDIVKYLRLRHLLRFSSVKPWQLNDDILRALARGYVHEWLKVEPMRHPPEHYNEGFNWLGDLRKCLPR